MKMFLKIIKYRFLSSLVHPVVLVCLLLALVSSLAVGIYAQNSKADTFLYPIAIVDEDSGEYSGIFIEQIKNNEQVDIVLLNRDTAIRQVSTGKIDGAFVLLDGFSDKIKVNEYQGIIEFISPSVTTSAYPLSEIVSSEVLDMWLMQLVKNTLLKLHSELGDDALISYLDVIEKIDTEYTNEDIITIDYISTNGDVDSQITAQPTLPIDKAVGVFATFIFFAIMLSGEWVFYIKKKSIQNRFRSFNTDLSIVCLASQVASVFVCMLFFIPLIIVMMICSSIPIYVILWLCLAMLLYAICVCSIAFVVSTFINNLSQLVVIGTSVAIINVMLSSLTIPLPAWATGANVIAKIFPGTYLLSCYDSPMKIVSLIIVTFVWVAIGYLCSIRLNKIVSNPC